MAATVLAALHWERRRSRPALVTLGLVCGFALDNHRTVIFLLPFLAAYVLLVDWQVLRKPAPLAGSALALLAPLLLYGVLWLRAATGSPWDQYDAGTWHGFLNVALGGADSAAHLDLPWQQALGRWRLLLAALPGAFSPLLLALALIGLIYLILRRRPEALLLGGYGLVMALFTLEWNVGSDLNLVYLMPAYVPVALLASSGIAWLCEAFRGRTAQTVGTLLLAAIAALAAYQDRGKLSPAPETLDDFRQQLFSGHQARRLASAFASLPPNATVVGDWDQATVFWYAQFVDRSNQTAAIVYPATKLQNAYGAAHGPVFLATSSVRPPTNVTVSAWGPLVQLGASPVAPPGPGICTFEGQIELAGIGPLPAPSYGVQPVTLQWRAVRRPDADYHVSVRLMPSPSVVATQRDEAAPVLGLSPPSTWQPGQVTADYYELDERGLPAGAYDLAVVLYQPLPNGGFRNLSCDGQERAIATRVNLPGSP
ncbi:MAG: hypothetical protein JOZ39_03405 [Chloroflexi bacterium]|nr:hypothetical protein [Chloroflexota bacterium]